MLILGFIVFLTYSIEYIVFWPLLFLFDILLFHKRELTNCNFLKRIYKEYVLNNIEVFFDE